MALSIVTMKSLVINCTKLADSQNFYQLLGLGCNEVLTSSNQPSGGIGLEGESQWRHCSLHDHREAAGPVIELWQWRQPPPWGHVNNAPNQLGYARLAIFVAKLDKLYQILKDQAVAALSELYCDKPTGLRWCYCRDPDGNLVELIERDGAVEFGYVVLNCEDLANSVAWYSVLFDLEPGPVQRLGVAPQLLDSKKPGEVISVQMNIVGQKARFGLVLQQWQQPLAIGRPLLKANQLGMFRLVFTVRDVAKAYEYLASERIQHVNPLSRLNMNSADEAQQRELLFMQDPTGACIELLQRD